MEQHPTTTLDHAFDVAWYKCISKGGGGSLETRGPYRNSGDDEFGNSDY